MSDLSTSLSSASTGAPTDVRLRLWPGVVIVGLLWLVRFGASLGEPSIAKFMIGVMIAPMAGTAALILWWLFASRVSWRDRLLVCGLFAAGGGAAAWFCGQNFPPMA